MENTRNSPGTPENHVRSGAAAGMGAETGKRSALRARRARFFDVEYALPAELIHGEQKVTVRFEATNGNEIGAVFGIRMIRADAQR